MAYPLTLQDTNHLMGPPLLLPAAQLRTPSLEACPSCRIAGHGNHLLAVLAPDGGCLFVLMNFIFLAVYNNSSFCISLRSVKLYVKKVPSPHQSNSHWYIPTLLSVINPEIILFCGLTFLSCNLVICCLVFCEILQIEMVDPGRGIFVSFFCSERWMGCLRVHRALEHHSAIVCTTL